MALNHKSQVRFLALLPEKDYTLPNTKPINIDKNLFLEKINLGCSNSYLMKLFNCSSGTISNRRKLWGVSDNSNKKIDICKTDLENLSTKEIIQKYECSSDVIYNNKKRNNIYINKRNKLDKKCSCPYCGKLFVSWLVVRAHTSMCTYNNHEYHIDEIKGAHHYSYFIDKSFYDIKTEGFKSLLIDIVKGFKLKNISIKIIWSKELFKEKMLNFYCNFKKVPTSKELFKSSTLPSVNWVRLNFASWNNGIKFCGLEPNKTLGHPTEALDGKIYRSILEANFVNKFLFDKYNYVVEPLYPSPYNYIYDFYIKELNLYVEVFGLQGWKDYDLKTIQKIEINNNLEINFLPVYLKDIQKFNTLQDIVENNLKNNLTITNKM